MKEHRPTMISIVVPVFNEDANITAFYQALTPVLSKISDKYDHEIIFTDNHSTDNTFMLLKELAKHDHNVRVIRFSRNFGFQPSIFTAYMHARGSAAIQLDADLQDPPSLILDFIHHWEKGYKVVYGVRRQRQEGKVINFLRKIFYRLIDLLSDVPLPHDAGDFRLVDRCVLQELAKIQDASPYLRGAIASIGFQQIGIPYDRNARQYGESKFSLRHYFQLAIDGIANHSILPLRLATYVSFVVSSLTFMGISAYCVGHFIFGEHWPSGFATLTSLILLSLSLNAFFLGIIGEYLGRIYQQTKRFPMTIIEQEIDHANDLTDCQISSITPTKIPKVATHL